MESESEELFRLIPIPMSATFIEALDKNLKKLGYQSRAQFLRDAAFEKATKLGVQIPRESTLGGRVNATISDVRSAEARKAKPDPVRPQKRRPNFDDPKELQAAADLAAIVAGPREIDKLPPRPKAASTIGNESARVSRNRRTDNRGSRAAERVRGTQAEVENPTDRSP